MTLIHVLHVNYDTPFWKDGKKQTMINLFENMVKFG